jgi:hypothetical protein
MLADEQVVHKGKRNFRRASILRVLEELVHEVRLVGVKVPKDVEINFAFVGVQCVDEPAALVNQSLQKIAHDGASITVIVPRRMGVA